MAGDLNISTSYLYQLIREERKPSIKLAERIEEFTRGEVTLEMLLGIEGEEITMRSDRNISDHQSLEYEKRVSSLEIAHEKIEERLESIEGRLTTLLSEVSDD